MKKDNENDRLIQQLIDSGSNLPLNTFSESDEKDFVSYQTVFDLLKTEPADGLSYSFASKVRRAVEQRANRKNDVKFYITASIMFVFISIAGYFLLDLIDKEAGNQVLAVILKYKWLLALGVFTFVGLHLFNPSLPKTQSSK